MIAIGDAVIEVTRKCNMTCEHCLRGKAQRKNQTQANIDEFFSRVSSISHLTFTGGEPSLVPEIIEYALVSAKAYNVEIGNFYIVTNGKNITESFVIACLRWYTYCQDNECSGVDVSQDNYHESSPDTQLLKGLSFFSIKPYAEDRYIIPEGNAEDWGQGRVLAKEEFEIDVEIENIDYRIVEGLIYLNCKGNIVGGCDWSYKNQNKHTICHVSEFAIDKMIDFGANISE